MKRPFPIAVAAIALLGPVACTDAARDAADPPTATTPDAADATTPDAAQSDTAPATAGLVFVPDPGLRVDFASNAKAGIDPSGTVYLYYQSNPSGQQLVATAPDGLAFGTGAPVTTYAYHPARLALADGSWRRYLLEPGPTFGSEHSDDGLAFTPEAGVRYTPAAADHGEMGVYDTFRDAAGGVVLLYLGDLHGKNNTRRAYAKDGLTFSYVGGNVLGDDGAGGGGQSYVDISSIPIGPIGADQRRLFAMKGGAGIYSFIADRDGTAFTQEPGVRLARTDFSEFTVVGLFDPTVVELPDGSFRMYLTAQIGSKSAIVSAHAE